VVCILRTLNKPAKKNFTSNIRSTQCQTSKQDCRQEFVLFNKLAKSQHQLIRGVLF